MTSSNELPLAGLTVVDMSQFLSGPYCSLRLMDLGARVIKIERPDGGDLSRRLYLSDTEIGGDSTICHAINRNKESLAIDLKDADDLVVLKRLLARADVMIQNFRPGVIERLGLDYVSVERINPGLVYASISGYGEEGPWAMRPGQDLLAQARSGVMWLNGDEDQGPVPFGLAIADMLAGSAAAQAILAALVRRGVTGRGSHVDTSLLEALIDFQFEVLTTHLNDNRRLPRRAGFRSAHAYLAAPYGVYPTADGFLAIAMTPIPKLADLLGIEALAPELRALYEGAPQNVLPSAYDDFTAPPKPWKWCHSESYQGNPWRVAVTKELRRLVEGLRSQSIVSDFEVSDSNNDSSQQINQIRAFIDKKCTIITSIPGSATALNDAVDAAHATGIPFVTAAGSVTSPNAVNVDSNYARWGYEMITAIGKELGGRGYVLVVEGIAGHPIVAQEAEGLKKGLAKEGGLKVARTVNGNWTANVTKTVVLQALATNPAKIDAVWTTGSESRVIAEAFAQAGRPAPLITGSITGDALGYWKAHPDRYRFEGHGVLPAWPAQTLFRVGVRTLEGQKPKLNTLLMPIPAVHSADLANWYQSCMTPDAVSTFPVPPADPMPESVMDSYFQKPASVPTYDYTKVPQACASK